MDLLRPFEDNNTTTNNKQSYLYSDTNMENSHKHIKANYNNNKEVVNAKLHPDKVNLLKSQLEKQMKAYVKQEEYEEMLKLIKKLNFMSNDKWQELEHEVDKMDYSEVEYKSTADFLTDDEIAVLASDIHTPYSSKSINEIIELSHKNSEIRQSTPLMKTSKNGDKPSDNIEMKQKFSSHENNNYNNDNYESNHNNNNNLNNQNLLSNNYARKRSILRKLMICQRKKFMFKKEQLELNRMKKNLADTSISNFSQAEGFVNNEQQQNEKVNSANDENNDQADNIKYVFFYYYY